MAILRLVALLLTLTIPLGLPSLVRAQGQTGSPEALQAANELFSVLSKDMLSQMAGQVTAQVWPSIDKSLRTKYPDLSEATIAGLRGEFERIQASNLVTLMVGAPAIYARYFTVQELREMLAYHRSPTGAKALRVLPQVMGEFMAGMLPRLKDVQAQTMDAFNKVLRERGYNI